MRDNVFHRDFNYKYPLIDRARGVYLYSEDGRKYLDVSSGAIAVSVGHGNQEIVYAILKQANKVAFAHTMRFETKILHDTAKLIASLAPEGLKTVYFTSGGAEANESAFKLARQYHIGKGNNKKTKIIGRFNSYHGNTIWTLSVGGDSKRRELYSSDLHNGTVHVFPPYWSRDPYNTNLDFEDYGQYCVKQMEKVILEQDPDTISALILEPIIGSQVAALVPPNSYLRGIRELCTKYDIVMIADEVMTGFGRTGKAFAVDHWSVEPDIITFAKGVSSAYLPLGGLIAHDRIVNIIKEKFNGKFAHGFTFSGHPLALAAGKANIEYMLTHNLFDKAIERGNYLMEKLKELAFKHPIIGEIRGKGLLIGFELVADKASNKSFLPEFQAAERLAQISLGNGAVLYPGQGKINEQTFDHILIGPPLIITEQELDEFVSILDKSLDEFSKAL